MAGPSFTIKIEGRERLERAFNALPMTLQRKALRPALRAAAKVVQAEVKHTAHSMLGASNPMAPHVADSIKVRAMKRDRSKRGRLGMVVQAGRRTELGIPASAKGYYPAHVEFGYLAGPRNAVQGPLDFTPVKRGPNGEFVSGGRTKKQALDELNAAFRATRRHIPGRPFMKIGLERSKARALEVMADVLSAQLKKMAGLPDISDAEFYADALGPDESADVF